MKILVTGGAGFIGSHVVDAMVEAGHQVVIVDNLTTGRTSNLNPKAKFYKLDIRSPQLSEVFEIERPEIVDHHAAQVDVRRSVSDPLYDADVNIQGGIRLIQLCLEFGVRKFIYISSGGAVYGEPEYLPCDENHPIHPLAPYGASKYTLEMYLYLNKQVHGLDYTILRYGNVYGPRQDPNGEAGVVAIFTGRMLQGQSVMINGSGEQERDFVYVGDCARANLMVLDQGSGQIYNLASGEAKSINRLFSELKEIAVYKKEPLYGPAKLGETFRIFLDASKARAELDWQPLVDMKQGLSRTVEYFRKVELA